GEPAAAEVDVEGAVVRDPHAQVAGGDLAAMVLLFLRSRDAFQLETAIAESGHVGGDELDVERRFDGQPARAFGVDRADDPYRLSVDGEPGLLERGQGETGKLRLAHAQAER